MDGPRLLWYLGLAVLAIGIAYGLYVGATAEGLAALAGPIIIMMAVGLSVVVLAAAALWRPRELTSWMLVITGVVALVAAAGGLWIAVDARVWLPWAVAAAGLLGLAAAGRAWRRTRA